MAATSGYAAGVAANDTQWSYAQETTWNVSPTTAYQAIRTTGNDSMQGTEQRNRPPEFNTKGEAAAAITTQVSAGGSIPMALSYGTFDDLLSGLLRAEWGAPVAVNGAGADLSLVTAGNKLTSTTAGKFANLVAGTWINLSGFALQSGRLAYILAKTSDTDITLSGLTVVNETPVGASGKIRSGGALVNDTVFKSFTLRDKLGAAGFMHYPGAIVTQAQLNAALGDFLSGSLTLAASDDVKSVPDIAASLTAAPTGRVHDNVRGFGGFFIDGVRTQATMKNVGINISNEGAGGDFGLGSPTAQGMRLGTFGANMNLGLLFRDWSIYDRTVADSLSGVLSAATLDSAGNAYVLSLLNGRLLNPNITAGRPGEPVMVTATAEGNPQAAGGTLRIERLPAA